MDPALPIKKRLKGMHELSNPIGADSDRIIKKGYMNFPFHEPPQSMATKHFPEPHDKFCLSKNQKPQLQQSKDYIKDTTSHSTSWQEKEIWQVKFCAALK